MVVDFSVVTEPQVRVFVDLKGLHSLHVLNDGQPVKAKRAVFEVVDVLDAECVWPSMADTHTGLDLLRYIFVTTEYRPNTAHFDQSTATQLVIQ